MGLFRRMGTLWVGFWSALIGKAESGSHNTLSEGLLLRQKQQLLGLRQTITQLIFQRKRLNVRIEKLQSEILENDCDLKEAAKQERDELALQLIAKQETLGEEHSFLKGQYEGLSGDLEKARDTEKQFVAQMEKSRHQLQSLSTRKAALKTRRDIKQQLSVAGQSFSTPSSEIIDEQILRLEAECEVLESDSPSWEKELNEMRSDRKKGRHLAKLQQIKSEERGNFLTGRTAVPVH